MKRLPAVTTRKIIELVKHEGLTLAQAAAKLGIGYSTANRLVNEHYKSESGLKAFRAKVRANAKAQREAAKLIGDTTNQKKEIAVVETGFLMRSASLPKGEVVVPRFCVRELEKLQGRSEDAIKALKMLTQAEVPEVFLKREKECLYQDPELPVRPRSRSIVCIACDLDSLGYEVTVYTNSHEVEDLIKLQQADMKSVYVV